jgi:hypothetical protein
MRTITTNNVNLSDLLGQQCINNLVCIEATSRRSQDGPALFVNVFDNISGQGDPIIFHIGVEALVAPFDAEDLLNFIVVVKAHEQLPDHNIQAWAQPSTGHDADLGFFRIRENVSAGTCLDKLDGLSDIPIRRIGISRSDEVLILNKGVTGQEA